MGCVPVVPRPIRRFASTAGREPKAVSRFVVRGTPSVVSRTLGRSVVADPIMDLTNAQQAHGYANNNPVASTEPRTFMCRVCTRARRAVAENAGNRASSPGMDQRAPGCDGDPAGPRSRQDPLGERNAPGILLVLRPLRLSGPRWFRWGSSSSYAAVQVDFFAGPSPDPTAEALKRGKNGRSSRLNTAASRGRSISGLIGASFWRPGCNRSPIGWKCGKVLGRRRL